MIKKCIGCGSTLQTENINKEGYIKETVYSNADYCERCFKIMHYGECSVIEKKIDIMNFLETIDKNIPVIYLLDLTCISNTTVEPLKKIKNKIYLVLTKRDLLPKSVKDKKLIKYIKENYINLDNIFITSSEKMLNIEILYNKLIKDNVSSCYILGYTNSGKSSLLNSFLKLKGKKGTITTSPVPNTTTELINIKLDDKLTLIDTPGFINENSITNFISIKEYKTLLQKKEIKPKIYHIRPNFMIIVDNIIRIENTSDKIISLIFYLKNELNYKKIKITTSDELKIYEKSNMIINDNEDIVIEGLGFIKVPNYSCITIYVIDKRVISKRSKMI